MKRKKFDKILNYCRIELDILENNTFNWGEKSTEDYPYIFLTEEAVRSIEKLYQKIKKLRRHCENEQNRQDNLRNKIIQEAIKNNNYTVSSDFKLINIGKSKIIFGEKVILP